MEWISAGLSWKTRFAEGQGALAFVFLSAGLGVAGCSSPDRELRPEALRLLESLESGRE